jgi:hypothetical protein
LPCERVSSQPLFNRYCTAIIINASGRSSQASNSGIEDEGVEVGKVDSDNVGVCAGVVELGLFGIMSTG